MKEKQQIVAILTTELKAAQVFSSILRKVKVFSNYFSELKSFWEEILKERPSLIIVDVKTLAEGDLYLKDHPLISERQIPIILYYNDQTVPLLYSLPDLTYIGLVKYGEPLELELELKIILERINKEQFENQEKIYLEQTLIKAKNQEAKFKDFFQGYQKEKFFEKQFKDLVNSLKEMSKEKEIFDLLCSEFEKWEAVESFTFYELSLNGQKLVSPTLRSFKYKKFPSLWLGQICSLGIELFAQNMAIEVCTEEYGLNYAIIPLRGIHQFPDIMVFLKVPKDYCKDFDWIKLEEVLDNIYKRNLLQKNVKSEERKIFLQAWDFMSLLDQEASIFDKKNIIFFDLDFSELLEVIVKNNTILFYWKNFFEDFLNSFLLKFGEDIRASLFGPQHLGVIVRNKEGQDLLKDLKNFGAKFPFWRYFEDSEIVLAESIKVHVKMIPPSSLAYLNYLKINNKELLLDQEFAENTLKTLTGHYMTYKGREIFKND